jgi:hypothetical protein
MRRSSRKLALCALVVLAVAAIAVLVGGVWPSSDRATSAPGADARGNTEPGDAGTRYVAPGGRPGDCSRSAPCGSLADAYDVAAPGDRVEVAGGHYPPQEIPSIEGRRAPRVRIAPAPGARVTLTDELAIYGDHVELAAMKVGQWYVKPGADDVVLRDIDSAGRAFITSATDVHVIGGDLGPATDSGAVQIKAETGATAPPRDLSFEGVHFHDFTRTAAGKAKGVHMDCLHVMAVDGLVLRGNRFTNCEAFSILFSRFGDAGSPRNVRIENNFIDCCRSGYYALFLGGDEGTEFEHFLIRNNSSNENFYFSEPAMGRDIRVEGNVAVSPRLCPARVQFARNLWSSGQACGPGDRVADPRFRNAAEADFHLLDGSPAIDMAGEGGPAADIDGQRRAGPRDAGADELDPDF